jgi:Bacterial PH domain
MMESQQETTLAKVRLHWGIFIPALMVAVALITVTSLFFYMANALSQIARQINPSPAAPRFNLLWLVFLLPDFVIVPGLFLATWFAFSKSEVTLTDRRLVYRTGFWSRRSGELPLENVESIFISEPLFGRICGYGTVMVTTVGGSRFPFTFIGSPKSFHSKVQQAVANCKKPIRAVSTPPQEDDSRYKPKG